VLVNAKVDEQLAGTDALTDLNGQWFGEWERPFGAVKSVTT